MDNKILGAMGENIAARFLRQKGYAILYRNWRCSFGEIDIVAQEKDFLVFIEIKTRWSYSFGPGYLSVDRKKQLKLIKLGQAFLKRYCLTDKPCRIDIVSLHIGQNKKVAAIELIKDAFWENEIK